MGSAASASVAEMPGGDLRLPASGLRFTVNQLRALNSYVDTLWEDDQKDRISTELESTIESLVQRIVDGAGQKDPRFRCSHLIALHRGKKMKSRSLEYLVTLDALPVLNSSEDCHLVEGALCYGRIRLSAREADRWQDLLTPSGYLCRDKVVERWVELIARCTSVRASATANGSRVLSAPAHAAARPYTYCYLERVSSSNIQSSLDRRLAIVEGSAWVMVRAGSAEAKLVLGARVRGVPGPALRLPVTHPMAMLYYTASQQGYYAVAIGPPSSMVCGDRGSNWQLWNPALEASLDGQLSDLATAAKVAGAVNALVDYMREGAYQGSLLSVSRYQAWCCWRKRLQRCWRLPTAAARAFVSPHAAHHMLLVLDEMYSICANNTPAGYWIPVGRQSLCRRGARGPRWEADAACIRQCLMQLHRTTGEEIPPTPAENLETALFSRWESLNKESAASAGGTYCKRQLRYLHALFGQLVACHSLMDTESPSTFHLNLLQATSFDQQSVEDLIHILAIILDQARELYVTTFHSLAGNLDEDLKTYRTKKWLKLKDYYDASSACLIDAVRRDPDLRTKDFTDPIQNTKIILKWLNKGAKEDKKYLGPVLRPYLDGLFISSLENCWFYDSFDQQDQELEGLKEYCLGVHEGLDACSGLVEAAKKHAWAKVMVDFVDRFKHIEFRLVFPTGDGMGVSVPVSLPRGARSLTLSRADKRHAKLRLSRRALDAAVFATLTATTPQKLRTLPRHESEEILASVKSGNYWRNSTKPDIIPSTQDTMPRVRRRSRRSRPATSYGFPEISITKESDAKTLRRKYHTLKSLVYTEPVDVKEMRQRPRSAGSSVRHKEAMSRPSILETMDFINSVKEALNVEESGASDIEDNVWSATEEWWAGWCAPLNVVTSGRRGGAGVDSADGVTGGAPALHLTPRDLAPALLRRGCFTILQEISVWLVSGREGALFALHRLARDARSRSSERNTSSWKLPEGEGVSPQQYRARPPDYMSGDEAPPPPPLPRTSSTRIQVLPRYPDYNPPNRIQTNSQHNPTYSQTSPHNPNTKQSTTQRDSSGSADFKRDNDYPNIVQRRGELSSQRGELGSQRDGLGSQRGKLVNQRDGVGSQRGELGSTNFLNVYEPKQTYTGIINPIYDIKIPKDKFQVNQVKVKRSRSLGRSFSTKSLGIEVTKYNLTLGQRSGKKTNDVVTAITGMSGETALETKSNFFQRRTTAEVVGDSYRVSRVTID